MAKIYENEGIVEKGVNYIVVKKVGRRGEIIPKHNHPSENIVFTIVKGELEVKIDENVFITSPGKVITFDGNSYISAKFIEDGEVIITLIKKP